MNREQFTSTSSRELVDAINLMIELFPALTGREVRIRSVLAPLAQRAASNSASFELLNLCTADEMAPEWGVSASRARAIIADRHERFGVGRKIGKTWVLSAREADSIVIATKHRRK